MVQIETKLHLCEEDDPDRCQADGSGGEGQCRYLSVRGIVQRGLSGGQGIDVQSARNATNCPKHHGFMMAAKEERQKLHDYRLQVWQERIEEFSESEKVKSLRGEIAIVRLLVETILNQCSDARELMMYSTKLCMLVGQIEKLVRSCDRLESGMGLMLDRAQALLFATQVVELIGKHVNDAQAIDEISSGIIDALGEVTNVDPLRSISSNSYL